MRIRVVCPEQSAYEGEAAFVALPSTAGEVGVLPHHASEICTLARGYVRAYATFPGDATCMIAVEGGYAEIDNDEIIVLASRARDLATVNADEVQADLQGFEEQLSILSDDDARRAYLYNEIAWRNLLLKQS